MPEQETRLVAAANELAQLLAQANARCANFAGDLSVASQKIVELEEKLKAYEVKPDASA